MAKFIPMINCGYHSGSSPMAWELNPIPFNTEEECNQWIEDNEDNFTLNEIGGGIYAYKIEDDTDQVDQEKEIRIAFRAEVYIKGKDLESMRNQWYDLPLFSADALERYGAEFIEITRVERVDDDSYQDITKEFEN